MKKLKDDTITKQKFFETAIKSNFNKNTRLILRDIIVHIFRRKKEKCMLKKIKN